MTLTFHPDADEEFREAVGYYETCQRGLGEEFYLEVHSTIDRVLSFPQTWPVLEGDDAALCTGSPTASSTVSNPRESSSLP
jgi:hypothetical protein